MKGVALAVVVLTVVLVAAGTSASRTAAECKPVALTGAAFSASSKWLAVARQRACDALPSLVVMRTDGRSRRTIGKSVLDWSWAPRGDRIAFSPVGAGGSSLVVATPTGRRVTSAAAVTTFVWAPNGRELAARRRGREDIVVVPLAGPVRHLVDASLGGFRLGHALEWAPNGRSVLYTRAGDGTLHSIRDVARDGSDDREITRGRSPDWSPDGSRIVYDAGSTNLPAWTTVGPDGADPRSVGPGARTCLAPTWAPRGRRLAFTALCSLAGTEPMSWIDASAGGSLLSLGSGFVAWSPTGQRLALWTRAVAGATLMDADGTDRVELPYRGAVWWAPRGTRFAIGSSWTYLVGANGRPVRRVARGVPGRWAPNGRLLALLRTRRCGDDLNVLRLTPQKLRRVLSCG